ncbi:MAG: hypothetical protein KDA80_14530, partial [Planctomycetaceae bacterium]|nr:hypothetical protein [Planctomycetaceae bacterium]
MFCCLVSKAVASALEQISGKQLTEAGDRLANQPAARDNMSGQFIEGVGQHGGEAIESLNGGVALT